MSNPKVRNEDRNDVHAMLRGTAPLDDVPPN